jgi:thioesterase domain-containing protein
MAHDKGWSRVCTRPLDIRWIQGYHATLLKEPNVRLLAAEIRSALTGTSAASLVDAQQSEHHAPVVN